MNRTQGSRIDRMVQSKRHDVYRSRKGKPEITACPTCGVWFDGRRWVWGEAPETAAAAPCPACRRIADNYPAGYVDIGGPFFSEHREEILNLVRNVESAEKADHPLERIMDLAEKPDGVALTTTGVHLARRLGEALSRAYNAPSVFRYADDDNQIRVSWHR